jgi:hypothetical protein
MGYDAMSLCVYSTHPVTWCLIPEVLNLQQHHCENLSLTTSITLMGRYFIPMNVVYMFIVFVCINVPAYSLML